MNRETGGAISDLDHINQSIADILTTPLGSRRMRPDYGSKLRRFVDLPVTEGWKSAVQAEAARAIGRWEPEFKLEQVRVLSVLGGQINIQIRGEYLGVSQLFEVSA